MDIFHNVHPKGDSFDLEGDTNKLALICLLVADLPPLSCFRLTISWSVKLEVATVILLTLNLFHTNFFNQMALTILYIIDFKYATQLLFKEVYQCQVEMRLKKEWGNHEEGLLQAII